MPPDWSTDWSKREAPGMWRCPVQRRMRCKVRSNGWAILSGALRLAGSRGLVRSLNLTGLAELHAVCDRRAVRTLSAVDRESVGVQARCLIRGSRTLKYRMPRFRIRRSLLVRD